MDSSPFQPVHLQFAEEMGILMEQTGHPRIAGKILGLLLITTEPRVSSEDLAKHLKASKGSISTMTRFLLQLGLVEKIGVPGDRRDYFRARAGMFGNLIQGRIAQVREYRMILRKGMSLIPERDSAAYERLNRFHEFYEFFEKEFSAALSRWETLQSGEPKDRILENSP